MVKTGLQSGSGTKNCSRQILPVENVHINLSVFNGLSIVYYFEWRAELDMLSHAWSFVDLMGTRREFNKTLADLGETEGPPPAFCAHFISFSYIFWEIIGQIIDLCFW